MTRVRYGLAFAAVALVAVAGAPSGAGGLGPTLAHAQEADDEHEIDYYLESKDWNGLYTLAAVANGLQLQVEHYHELDWSDLSAEDILFVLYPTQRLDPGHLTAFVRNGGHVLVADDFGNSSEAITRLGGMLRDRAIGVEARRFYRDLQYVPMARPLIADHPLAQGVTELATNHPSMFSAVSGPEVVFGFSASEGVVVAGQLGNGRFIVCSDPSIFINRMLQFEGNLQFAFNAMRFLRRPSTRRLIVLSGDFTFYGQPADRIDDGTVRGSVTDMLSDFNRWLDERNDYLLTAAGMRAVAIILAGLIGFLALLTLPFLRKSSMDGAWTRARATNVPPDDYDHIVGRFESIGRRRRASRRANYLLPAAILRDGIAGCVERISGLHDPLASASEFEIANRLMIARGQMASSTYKRLHKKLTALPTRVQAASPWSTGFLSRNDFERLHEDALELFLALGEEPG